MTSASPDLRHLPTLPGTYSDVLSSIVKPRTSTRTFSSLTWHGTTSTPHRSNQPL